MTVDEGLFAAAAAALLGLTARLLGACAETLAPAGQARAQTPAWSDVSAALAATRPDDIPQDPSDPRAFVCEVYFANDAALGQVAEYDWGFGDFNSGWVIGRRSQYLPSDHYGQRLTAAIGASILGACLVYFAGFSHIEAVHNAAHDTRHSAAFPCH